MNAKRLKFVAPLGLKETFRFCFFCNFSFIYGCVKLNKRSYTINFLLSSFVTFKFFLSSTRTLVYWRNFSFFIRVQLIKCIFQNFLFLSRLTRVMAFTEGQKVDLSNVLNFPYIHSVYGEE